MTGTPPISPRGTKDPEISISASGEQLFTFRVTDGEEADDSLVGNSTELSLRVATPTLETWQARFEGAESEDDLKTCFEFADVECDYDHEVGLLEAVKAHFEKQKTVFEFSGENWEQICNLAIIFNQLPSEILEDSVQ